MPKFKPDREGIGKLLPAITFSSVNHLSLQPDVIRRFLTIYVPISFFVITALLVSWLTMVSIQLIFIVFVFSRTALYRTSPPEFAPESSSEGVTIVVCAHNERQNLTELLPLLAQQQHPRFDVLLMDDRSSDGTKEWLPEIEAEYPNIRSIRVENDYDHVSPKKYALTIALKKATYPTVLLTDADCRPASDQWLADMEAALAIPGKDIVLGVSMYQKQAGFLNFLIRSETLFTAVQYLSLALAGQPYMGVGRNLLYRRQTFFANKGFYTHINVLGGDDDLFINEVATGANTTVSLSPTTFTKSFPKQTWADWRHQKRRHLSVGHRYKTGHKIRLGLLTGSYVSTWLLGLVAGGYTLYEAQHDATQLMNPLLLAATGAFLLRWLLFWLIVGRIGYRLDNTVRWYAIPFMDVILAAYYTLMGLTTLLSRRRKIHWR